MFNNVSVTWCKTERGRSGSRRLKQSQIFHFIIFLKKQIYIRNEKYKIKKKIKPRTKEKVLQCYKRRLYCREKLNTSVTPDVKLVPRVKTRRRRRRRHVTRGSNSWLFTVRRWRAVIQSRKTWTCKLVLDQLLYDVRAEGGSSVTVTTQSLIRNRRRGRGVKDPPISWRC